jgi:hypothetical protein
LTRNKPGLGLVLATRVEVRHSGISGSRGRYLIYDLFISHDSFFLLAVLLQVTGTQEISVKLKSSS